MWLALCTIFLLLLVAEAAREAFFGKSWAARHHPKMQPVKELPWWAYRRSGPEKRDHQHRWHIDLPRPRAVKAKR
jgi:hypothetical protein